MVTNLSEQYPHFVKEFRRLGWLNGTKKVTPTGLHALTELSNDLPTGAQ